MADFHSKYTGQQVEDILDGMRASAFESNSDGINVQSFEVEVRKRMSNNNTSATNENLTTTDSICSFRIPNGYTPTGRPCRVIAFLHGGGGTCTPAQMGYASSGTYASWVTWQNEFLNMGFLVFDINGYDSTAAGAAHYGCPEAVETMKKSFEYLKRHYNIEHQMSIFAVSMGGALAQSYTMNYPNDVKCCVFDACLFLQHSAARAASDSRDKCAQAFGYTNAAAMDADNMEKLRGYSLGMQMDVFSKNGVHTMIPDWTKFWMVDSASASEHFAEQYIYRIKFPVPCLFLAGASDTTVTPRLIGATCEAFRNGGSNAIYREYAGLNHTQMHGNSEALRTEVNNWIARHYYIEPGDNV